MCRRSVELEDVMEKPIKIIEKNKAGPPELREVVDAERAQVVNGTLTLR